MDGPVFHSEEAIAQEREHRPEFTKARDLDQFLDFATQVDGFCLHQAETIRSDRCLVLRRGPNEGLVQAQQQFSQTQSMFSPSSLEGFGFLRSGVRAGAAPPPRRRSHRPNGSHRSAHRCPL